MNQLKELLVDLVKVEGITAAVVVGRDGFVIEGVTQHGGTDTEAVGAVISTGIGSSEVIGRELEVGNMTQGMIEYDNGIVVMSLLGPDAILAVVAQPSANLGNVRYQIRKRAEAIQSSL